MKQCKIIFVPNDKGQQETDYLLCRNDIEHPVAGLDQEQNVIVLTIEELREVWDAGWENGYDDAQEDPVEKPSPNFKTYLTSKGITL